MVENNIFKALPWYKKIHVLRVIKGWSQSQAAEKCGTHQKLYWLWENGKAYPRLENRKALAKAYGVRMEDIFPQKDGTKQ